MRKLFALLVLVVWGAGFGQIEAESVRVGFESTEGYTLGSEVSGEDWQVEEGSVIVIDGEEKAKGLQSLRMEAGTPVGALDYTPLGLPAGEIRFIDLQIKPVGQSKEAVETQLSAWGSSLGFVSDGGNLKIAPVNGDTAVDLVDTKRQSGENGAGNGWLRITIRQDVSGGTWDLFVDGRLAAIDVAMDAEGLGSLVLFGHELSPTWIDEVVVDTENPLFADQDKDGMPDAEEEANGLNPFLNDRNGDVDGDGINNIEEARAGTSPRAPNTRTGGVQAPLIYVDNRNGNDANNGARSYRVGADGPKASIKAAMASARDGSTIVIMPGKGIYNEGSRGAPGKSLTIKALSNVTIK